MERLTIRNTDGSVSQPTHSTFEKVFNRLAEYEDLGKTPEELKQMLGYPGCDIPTAEQIWRAQTNRTDFDNACKSVLRAIEKASADGKREIVFDPLPRDQYNAVKATFFMKGYKFRPYGYSGGVWQNCELIGW